MTKPTHPDVARAAYDRVDRFLVEVSRRPVEEWPMYALRPIHPGRHRRALVDAQDAVHAAGLDETLGAVLRSVDDWVLERYGYRSYDPTFAGPNWNRSPGTADDRVRVAESLRAAVTAIVVGPGLADDAVAELVAGWAWAAEGG